MTDYDHKAECDRFGIGGSVRRAFVTLIDVGCVPEGKGPFLTADHLWQFIGEAIAGRPVSTQIIVHQLTWNDELWTGCGREMAAIAKALAEADCA